jgi:hypothetical protein
MIPSPDQSACIHSRRDWRLSLHHVAQTANRFRPKETNHRLVVSLANCEKSQHHFCIPWGTSKNHVLCTEQAKEWLAKTTNTTDTSGAIFTAVLFGYRPIWPMARSETPAAHGLLMTDLFYTAEWRRERAKEFPDDHRNIAAAELLEKLAARADDIRGTDLERRYFKVLESDGHRCCDTESETLRAVRFHSWPANATEFFDGLVTKFEEKLEDLVTLS